MIFIFCHYDISNLYMIPNWYPFDRYSILAILIIIIDLFYFLTLPCHSFENASFWVVDVLVGNAFPWLVENVFYIDFAIFSFFDWFSLGVGPDCLEFATRRLGSLVELVDVTLQDFL